MRISGLSGFLLVCIFASPFAVKISAQPASSDNVFYKNAVNNAISRYHQSSGDQAGIYNGSQYGGYNFLFKEGHPYFNTDKFTLGSIVYDGVLYDSVMLLFDEIKEVVVMQNVVIRVQFITDKIRSFQIHDHNFIYLVKDSNSSALINTGFYNLLYLGKTSLFKKEMKNIREQISNIDGLQRFVDTKTHYYIRKEKHYYSIKRRKDLFALFNDRRKEVQQFMKENRLSYRKDRDNTLTKVTAYYDGLIK